MKKIILIILIIFNVSVFAGQQDCLDAELSRGAAVNNQDWNQVIKSSNKTLIECKGLYSKKQINNNKIDVIVATYYLGNVSKVLKLANECIDNFYNTPVCHYWIAVSHMELGNLTQYNASKKNAYKVARFVIEKSSRLLSSETNKIEQMQLQSDIDISNIVIKNLDELN
jgi:formyltetrahydrofolate synthetase